MACTFGVFDFDAESRTLRKSGRMVRLEPQPAKALARLLAEPGALVTRDALRAAVWGPDTHVDFDRGLAYCISQVRAALGDDGDNPRFVETIPRKGYRFIAPVQNAPAANPGPAPAAPAPDHTDEIGERAPAPAQHRPARLVARHTLAAASAAALVVAILAWTLVPDRPAAPSRVIIAVSIFDNETGIAAHDRLIAGLADLVVTHLSGLDPTHLGVIGNAAVLRQPRNIRNLQTVAAGVQADYVVLGQLQQAEQGLRFITHLIRLSDETHLEANRISLPDGTLNGLEAAVVAEFERAVRAHVLPEVAADQSRGPHLPG